MATREICNLEHTKACICPKAQPKPLYNQAFQFGLTNVNKMPRAKDSMVNYITKSELNFISKYSKQFEIISFVDEFTFPL